MARFILRRPVMLDFHAAVAWVLAGEPGKAAVAVERLVLPREGAAKRSR